MPGAYEYMLLLGKMRKGSVTRAQGKQDPENHIQALLTVASATDAGYGTVNRTPERRSVLGEKNGRVKRIIVVLLLSTIYNNVQDNNKDNDKKKK